MFDINRVTVVVDPYEERSWLIDKVVALAEHWKFDLRLISVEHTQYLVEGYYFDGLELERLREEYLGERRDALEALAEPLRANGMSVTTAARWGHPAHKVVVADVAQAPTDLVVFGPRRHTLLERVLLSHDHWELVRACPVPVLVARERAWSDPPRIICAVDPMHRHSKPSGLDEAIVEAGKTLAERSGGALRLLHAYGAPALSGTYPATACRLHGEALARLADAYAIAEEQTTLSAETPDVAILQADRDVVADVVVMGVVSRSHPGDWFIGNTAEKVLDYLESDILVIKPGQSGT